MSAHSPSSTKIELHKDFKKKLRNYRKRTTDDCCCMTYLKKVYITSIT